MDFLAAIWAHRQSLSEEERQISDEKFALRLKEQEEYERQEREELQKQSEKSKEGKEVEEKLSSLNNSLDKKIVIKTPRPNGDWDTGRFPWDHH